MEKLLYSGKGGLASYILWFIHPSKPIRDKYLNRPKSHNLKNLVLIAEAEKRIRINSGVSNEFYTASQYANLTKERGEK